METNLKSKRIELPTHVTQTIDAWVKQFLSPDTRKDVESGKAKIIYIQGEWLFVPVKYMGKEGE